jgi:glucose/arabinose dehydrogenase
MNKLVPVVAFSISALLASGSLAQDAASATKVLSGAEAFGSWQDDAPGVRRHITPDVLPKADTSAAASNTAQPVPRPEGVMPKVPEGFTVSEFATGIDNPRAIRVAPNGDVFVANSEVDEVLVFRPGEGDAKPEKSTFATEGLSQPYGIAFYPPGDNPEWVYVANSDGLVRFPYKTGDLKAIGAPETLVEGIPAEHHWTRDIVFTPDGKTLYYSVGSGSNVAEGMSKEPEGGLDAWISGKALGATWGSEERRAQVLTFDPAGKSEATFATGLRNCAGMTLQPETNKVWCVVNERDDRGDNTPFEYATAVQQGAFYGWPWYYIGDNEDPSFKGARPDLAGKVTIPDVLFQAHSAPLGITFYEADAFPANYRGDAFVAMHGSWNRGTRTGYKVVRLPMDDAGKPSGEYEDFMTGFVVSDQDVWGRPVGVAVAKDGALLVTDDGSGTIWRVTH